MNRAIVRSLENGKHGGIKRPYVTYKKIERSELLLGALWVLNVMKKKSGSERT